jgi:demethoxyubiquinone hydroxylase (CLK1/Coq7/Cat5 family)
MPFSGMLRYVDFVRTEVSDERMASIIRVTRIGELGTTLSITNTQITLILKRATRHHIPEDGILQ